MASSKDGRLRAMHHQVPSPGVAKIRSKPLKKPSTSSKAGRGRR
jgi:hypothetical protein